MRLLYIEDERNDIELMTRYFQTVEHDLIVVTTIDELWRKIDDTVDIIMVDIFLYGEKSGYALANELRAKGYNQPLIAITGLVTSTDLQDIQKANFDAVIHKPFTFRDLEAVLEQFIY
ncbi:MAG TPA: response regulator [Aggregatilineales bacterium]|nr:response regulator [Aggregatilineales bacterium]